MTLPWIRILVRIIKLGQQSSSRYTANERKRAKGKGPLFKPVMIHPTIHPSVSAAHLRQKFGQKVGHDIYLSTPPRPSAF